MQEAYEKDFGCYYLVLLLSGPQPAAPTAGGGEPTPEEEGRVTGVTEWNWSDQVSQEQQTWMGNRKMEPWRRVAADTQREEAPKRFGSELIFYFRPAFSGLEIR